MAAPFHFKNGQLHCEDVNMENLFNSLPVTMNEVDINGSIITVEVPSTPAFVYSNEALKRNVKKYRDAISHANLDCRLGYALKANGNPTILKILKANGVEMLVSVSGYEILAGLQAGFIPQDIIFNGNGKQEWEIKLAIKTGVMLNVDSVFDARRISDIKKKFFPSAEVNVLLRIRPSVMVHKGGSMVHPYVNTAEASKFGFGMEELDEVLEVLCSPDAQIKIYGIHCHLGSCIYDIEVYSCMGAIMRDMTQELAQRGHNIKVLDIGGGIGIDYYKNIPGFEEYFGGSEEFISQERDTPQKAPDVGELIKVIAKLMPKTVRLILEPGRSLVADTGAVICRVLGTKTAGTKKYVVVDASMAEVVRPCLYGAHHQIYPTTLCKDSPWLTHDVVGPICETADFLGHNNLLQNPTPYLAIMDVGAYCSSMSSNYNMRPRPMEILVDNSTWKLIRKRDSFPDLMRQTNMTT